MGSLAQISLISLFSALIGLSAQADGGFTCGYDDIGKSKELIDSFFKIDRSALAGPLCEQSKLQDDEYTASPLAYGARKLMATMYGCTSVRSAFKPDPENPNPMDEEVRRFVQKSQYNPRHFVTSLSKVLKKHPYLKDQAEQCGMAETCSSYAGVHAEPESCEATRCFFYNHPPLYQQVSGVRLFYTSAFEKNKKFPKAGKFAYAGGTDCSGALTQSMHASGLLLMPKTEVDRFTTTTFWDAMGKPNSCFKQVEILDDLKPGDVLNAMGLHVVMINTVAKDPFNLKELVAQAGDISAYRDKSATEKDQFAKEKCKVLENPEVRKLFKFSILHSSPYPRGSDLGYQSNRGFPALNGTIGSKVIVKAKLMCVAEFWRQWSEGSVLKSSMLRPVLGYRYEIRKRKGVDVKVKVEQFTYVPCQRGDKNCVSSYESPALNQGVRAFAGTTAHARHSLRPDCMASSIPTKEKFDPYSCADTCQLDVKFNQLESSKL